MSDKSLALRETIRQILSECGCGDMEAGQEVGQEQNTVEKEPFYYLAPDVVGSINNLQLHPNKKSLSIGFDATDGKKFKLVVPNDVVHNWKDAGNQDAEIIDFV